MPPRNNIKADGFVLPHGFRELQSRSSEWWWRHAGKTQINEIKRCSGPSQWHSPNDKLFLNTLLPNCFILRKKILVSSRIFSWPIYGLHPQAVFQPIRQHLQTVVQKEDVLAWKIHFVGAIFTARKQSWERRPLDPTHNFHNLMGRVTTIITPQSCTGRFRKETQHRNKLVAGEACWYTQQKSMSSGRRQLTPMGANWDVLLSKLGCIPGSVIWISGQI